MFDAADGLASFDLTLPDVDGSSTQYLHLPRFCVVHRLCSYSPGVDSVAGLSTWHCMHALFFGSVQPAQMGVLTD